jgi:MFS family permease
MTSPVDLIKSALPDWPEWAMNMLITMTGALIITYVFSLFFTQPDEEEPTKSSSTTNGKHPTAAETKELHKKFDVFRRKYIIVYLIIMLADWMQGTHMYTLYLSYNVNISALFLTGFLSGAIFAPFLGSAVDKFGRKRSCIVYCVLEIIINVLEHFHDFKTLLLGRVLGGISTNLLFSAFESWMTTQHRHNGFPESWLQKTYAEASIGNGTMAVLAGIVAQLLEDNLGHIGPFQGAVALTALALVLILGWEENYGETKEGEHESSSLYKQFKEGWKATCTDSKIWRIGLTQAMSEGAMYTFVFMWVPTLLSMNPPGGLPTGCVFSSLMMAITMGGILFPLLHSFVSNFLSAKYNSSEITATIVYFSAGASMAVPAYFLSLADSVSSESIFPTILLCFVVVELCVGLFNPVAGTLRSKYVPDGLQGGILNIFRLPLNTVVVAGTYATDHLPPYQVFGIVSGCFTIAALLQASMIPASSSLVGEKKKTD